MSGEEKPAIRSIGWCDLTVPEASAVRDFCRDVVGWAATEVVRDPAGAVCALYESGD